MSRAVKADYDFDKELFADTLIKAIGARTQVKFSQDAGVSPAYLNRYLNKSVDKAPIPDTLRKIASASMGVLSYEELLSAAGYNPDKHKEQNIYNNSVRNDFIDGLVETIKNMASPYRIAKISAINSILLLKGSLLLVRHLKIYI